MSSNDERGRPLLERRLHLAELVVLIMMGLALVPAFFLQDRAVYLDFWIAILVTLFAVRAVTFAQIRGRMSTVSARISIALVSLVTWAVAIGIMSLLRH
jgi:hypothetical protein